MKNTFGNHVAVTLFGESHGPAVGAVIDGLPAGIPVDTDYIDHQLTLRRPQDKMSTARKEADPVNIQSGVYNGFTTGTPICILIPNGDTHSSDYAPFADTPRPSHADYTALCKYKGFSDPRGGGHFSGRLTAALVAAGAIILKALQFKGINIATHISKIAGVSDREFNVLEDDIKQLNRSHFAVLDDGAAEKMREKVLAAANDGDSVGGVLETVVTGIKAGVGEPWFDTVESVLSHALFSIPAVKGVEFGDGFALCDMRGSEANDPFCIKNGVVTTATNRNGGINGGITNGSPIIFRIAVKPTPTIHTTQNTVNVKTMQNTTLQAVGRHDPCIVQRARVVADSMTAIALCDLLLEKYGTDWLSNNA